MSSPAFQWKPLAAVREVSSFLKARPEPLLLKLCWGSLAVDLQRKTPTKVRCGERVGCGLASGIGLDHTDEGEKSEPCPFVRKIPGALCQELEWAAGTRAERGGRH